MSLLNHNSRTLWLLHKHRELPHIGFCACGYQRRLGTPFSDVFNMHTVICSPSVPSTNEKLNSRKKNTHKKIKKHIICSLLLRRWKLNLESQFSQVNWMRLPCRNKKTKTNWMAENFHCQFLRAQEICSSLFLSFWACATWKISVEFYDISIQQVPALALHESCWIWLHSSGQSIHSSRKLIQFTRITANVFLSTPLVEWLFTAYQICMAMCAPNINEQ